MPRSLKVHHEYIEKVKLAVRRNGFPSQRALAEDVGFALATVSNFLTGKSVDHTTFEEICHKLALSWREIADLDFYMPSQTVDDLPSQTVDQDKNTGVQSTNNHQDWGEAIDLSNFYGRTEELSTLKQWIVIDNCRLITVIGMGGIGKTSLSAKLAKQIQGDFEYFIWRSLRHAPPLMTILADLNKFFASESESAIPATIDSQFSHLFNTLRTHRCLLVLDDWEMILRSEDIAGYYRQGYEGYGELLKRAGQERHQSCLLLLSREKPAKLAEFTGKTLPVRSLKIKGLKSTDAKQLLATKGFSGTEKGLDELIQLYRGHPAALKVVTSTIRDLFNGNILQFLRQSSLVIGDIFSHLLSEHFERLSDLEKVIMYWLAIEYQPISIAQLKADIGVGISSSELLAMLESLRRRSLIEKVQTSPKITTLFTLQPVVMKYVMNLFIYEICENIIEAIKSMSNKKLGLFKSHPLVKQNVEEIKSEQINLILTRTKERLNWMIEDTADMTEQLQNLLSNWQGLSFRVIGYAEQNLRLLLEELEE